jgi:predicted ATPase/signal transduction histidine kinase
VLVDDLWRCRGLRKADASVRTVSDPQPYTIVEPLREDSGTCFYRAISNHDRRPVILKVVDPGRCRPHEIERLTREYELGKAVRGPAVVEILALDAYQGMPALVMEDFGGQSLDQLLGASMELERFLNLAIRITAALDELHQKGVIHKHIEPRNIFTNRDSGEVKLAELGTASRLPREHQAPDSPISLEGSLAYIAPEQTGRMNRAVDRRADLYSVGIVLYQLLTGKLPFAAQDPLEWVHWHIARDAAPPSHLVPELPPQLSRIVMRLLAKTAEDRYQTAHGLLHDLERCLDQWRAAHTIDAFALGEHDLDDRFHIPERLYGRDHELEQLRDAFERVANQGTSALVLVSGYSGIGKSSLVHELLRSLVQRHGLFISGKFEQTKRDIPYAKVTQAFGELIRQILADSEARLAKWRAALQEALGVHGQLLIDLLPQLELIVGRQPPLDEPPAAEAQYRFRRVLQRFIRVFATADHPLVIFLDDLQWADPASLGLLEQLITDAETRHLLVIGAYRDNEVGPAHPLLAALDKIREADGKITRVSVGPLSAVEFNRLVADTLRLPFADAEPLARLLFAKTAGNPFFAIQFLLTLHHDGVLALDRRRKVWTWDAARIDTQQLTDNVVELMLAKLKRLRPSTQAALKLAGSLGNQSDLRTLALLSERSVDQTEDDLREAIEENLLLRYDSRLAFMHDRVQQAAHALIADSERAALHLKIGRLLARGPGGSEGERIFELANHLNLGAALIDSREEKHRVASLDLAAGRQARAAGAYESAARYLAAGQALLAPDSWDTEYALTYGVYVERARCEWLSGDFQAADALLETLQARACGPVDQAEVYRVQIELDATRGDIERGARTALEACARLFAMTFPLHPSQELLRQTALRTWDALDGRSIESLAELAPMSDPETRAAAALLSTSLPAAYFADTKLHDLMCCEIVRLSLRHGNTSASPHGYVNYGALIGRMLGKWNEARRFGQLACDLVEKHGFVAGKPMTYFTTAAFINCWVQPLGGVIPLFQQALQSSLESGDLNHAGYSAASLVWYRLMDGEPLADVAAEAERQLDFTARAKNEAMHDALLAIRYFIRNMRGQTRSFSTYDEGAFRQDELEAQPTVVVPPWRPALYYTYKSFARVLSDDHEEAVRATIKAEQFGATVTDSFFVAERCYHGALARAVHHDHAPPGMQRELVVAIAAAAEQLGEWQSNCPQSFAHRHALIAAELARISGRDLEAMQGYERAIAAAREHRSVHNEAIANELASRFYRARGLDSIAATHLAAARAAYARWGALAKVRQLEARHPELGPPWAVPPTSPRSAGESLDLLAVVKASQAISGELVLPRLLDTLMRVVIEQAGAQRGHLMLLRDGEPRLVAEANVSAQAVQVRTLKDVEAAQAGLPASVLNYVRRTHEKLILDDAAAPHPFSGDPYFARQRPRSVLCVPILRQATLIGVVYLENNVIARAFTTELLSVLELLAAQAAISLENALLLADEQAARTAAEEAERRAEFIAEAGALLADSLEYQETFRRLGQLCVRSLADWCIIDLVESGQLRRIAVAHADPAKEPLLKRLQQQYPARWDSAHPASRVLRADEPIFMAELSEADLRHYAEDDEHAQIVSELGTRSGVAVPLRARGQTIGVLTLGAGASRRRFGRSDVLLAEELARRAATAIDNARLYRSAQEAISLRDEFLSIASHELYTPMTSLRLSLQVLSNLHIVKTAVGDELPKLVARADRQGVRLTGLIRNLLDVSQIEMGRLRLHPTEMDLVALVRDVVERLEPDLERARCPVTIGGTTSLVGFWDQSSLDQVVSNLMFNAIKFGPDKPIDIHLSEREGKARLAVRDHGVGIAPEQQARLFERFERGVSARHYGGLGLGLYICRRIVEAYGGTVSVESTVEAGATFTVEIPVRTAASIST